MQRQAASDSQDNTPKDNTVNSTDNTSSGDLCPNKPVACLHRTFPKLKVVSPINQSWTIEQIATQRPSPSWEKVFAASSEELKDISDILADEDKNRPVTQTSEGPVSFYPLKKDIFHALDLTPLSCVRVLLLGQDPYPQLNKDNGLPRAMGLSFSVQKNDSVPSSLRNIYTELERSIPGFTRPHHGDLTEWALRGVLLLNVCLTVRPGEPASHGQIWMGFVITILKALAECRPNTIYILLGRNSQRLQKFLEKATVITAPHPSGMSHGFIGSGVFKQVNDILRKRGEQPIDWQISD